MSDIDKLIEVETFEAPTEFSYLSIALQYVVLIYSTVVKILFALDWLDWLKVGVATYIFCVVVESLKYT
jgi:hypothetical protein